MIPATRVLRAGLLIAAAMAAVTGCGSRKSKRRGASTRRTAAAPAREWLATRTTEKGREQPGSKPAWARSDRGLPDMKARPLPETGTRPPQDTAEILRYLRSRKVDQRILGMAAAFEKRPPQALGLLLAMARRDPVFSGAATQAISAYEGIEGQRALMKVLAAGRAEARIVAVAALARRKIAAGSALERALVRAITRDRQWKVRAGAARALRLGTLGRFGARTELALIRVMETQRLPHPVRMECAAALAEAGVPGGWQHLRKEAFSPEADRVVLALALSAEVGGNRGASILGVALESRDTRIWTAAVEFFPMVGRDAAMMALVSRSGGRGEIARRAALALAPFEGKRLLPELVAAMENGSSVVRAIGCAALARAVGAEAAATLERKLLDSREVSPVRVAAARELGRVGGPVVATTLRRLARSESDEVVRAAARDALRLVEARLKKGAAAVSEASAERFSFSRWQLVRLLPRGAGCRLRDEGGRETDYHIGEEVAMGYRLARTLGAGDDPDSPEVVMAGRAATRSDLLRAILTKGDRSVVVVRQAIQAEK